MTRALLAWGRFLRLAFVVFVPFLGHAADAPLDDAAQQLDLQIQALKSEALDINRTGQSIEQNFLYPDRTRMTIYVGVLPAGLLVDQVSLTLDGIAVVDHHCDSDEAYGLQRGGLLRLIRINKQPGKHRIQADITARYADAKAGTPAYRLSLDETIEKTEAPAELELTLFLKGFDNEPHLRLRDWRPAP